MARPACAGRQAGPENRAPDRLRMDDAKARGANEDQVEGDQNIQKAGKEQNENAGNKGDDRRQIKSEPEHEVSP
jgi:hypothetical protein